MAADPGTARRNAVLAGLDERALASLLPDLGETPLPSGLVLHEPGEAIRDVYFPLVGVVSRVAPPPPGPHGGSPTPPPAGRPTLTRSPPGGAHCPARATC